MQDIIKINDYYLEYPSFSVNIMKGEGGIYLISGYATQKILRFIGKNRRYLTNLQQLVLGYIGEWGDVAIDGEYEILPRCKNGEDAINYLKVINRWERYAHSRETSYSLLSVGLKGQFFSKIINTSQSTSIYERDVDVIISLLFLDFLSPTGYSLNFEEASNKIRLISCESSGRFMFLPKGKRGISGTWGGITEKNKQQGSFGKVALKVIKEGNGVIPSKREIELFVNFCKFSFFPLGKFKTVSGEDISKSYMESMHSTSSDIGTLNKSCMKHRFCIGWFKIYEDNCKLLILESEENTILGRALLWEIDGVTYMDRIYGSESTIETFKKHAIDNKMYRKYHQNHYSPTLWVSPNGVETTITLTVELSSTYDYYPYCDTFKYLNEGETFVTNEADDGSYSMLESIKGEKIISDGEDDNLIYCEWNDESYDGDVTVYIDDSHYTGSAHETSTSYCEYTSNHHLISNMVELHDNSYCYDGYDELIYTGCDEYAIIDNCLTCEHDNEYYLQGDLVEIKIDDEFINLYSDNVEAYIEDNNLTKNKKGEYITKS